jgi:hypothetical protein
VISPRISTRRYNEGTLIDAEHDERVSVRAIAKSAPEGGRLIFLHRERIDVSDSAPFEMSGGGVMDGVGVTPEIIRRQRQHAAITRGTTR